MKTILSILLTVAVLHGAATVHRNVLKTGTTYVGYQNVDFNAVTGVKYGDTVYVDGDYGDFDAKKIEGVSFLIDPNAKRPATFRSFTIYEGAQARDIHINGKHPLFTYGIQIRGTKFGIKWTISGAASVKYCEIDGGGTGIKMVSDTLTRHAYDSLTLEVAYNWVHNIPLEGMYLGSDKSIGIFIYGYVHHNRVTSTGWDAIQCRVGQYRIENNVCDSIGLAKVKDQNHGILIGSNTRGSRIFNNIVLHVDGAAIFNNGFGLQEILCNNIAGNILLSNMQSATDYQGMGYTRFVVQGQNFLRKDDIALTLYSANKGFPTELIYEKNNVTGRAVIQSGVTVRQSGNGPGVPAMCGRRTVRKTLVYSDGTYETIVY